MKTEKTFYMHTLDGMPAEYEPRTIGVYFAGGRVRRLATSLRQIRREQQASINESKRLGGNQLAWTDATRYGYCIVKVPTAEKS